MYLETSRLILRNINVFDVEDYYQGINEEFVLKYNCMTHQTKEECLSFIQKHVNDDCIVVLALKNTNQLIGIIDFHMDSLRYNVNSVEISYWLKEAYANQGYMYEALDTLLTLLLSNRTFSCITARAFKENIASINLLLKLGFIKEGILKNAVKGYGDMIYDDVLFRKGD